MCHFSIELSLQNIHTGKINTMKIADIMIIAYQKFFMSSPAASLTFETSKGIIKSIVCESRNPTIMISLPGIVFH